MNDLDLNRWSLVTTLGVGLAAVAVTSAPTEAHAQQSRCERRLQNKIAWDYKGNKKWAPANLRRLCAGASGTQPAQCFYKVMHGGVSWGSSSQWKWENAIDLCERSTNADRTVSCFKQHVGRVGWQKAIAKCDERAPQLSRCESALQGKVAWDYKGNKKWATANMKRLCRGAKNAQPAKCFQRAMHSGINWGGGTQWKWENAIDLCERTTNSNRTISCFQKNVGNGGWQKAIARCDERAPKVTCRGAVQNKIAWDYKGSKKWARANLDRLCGQVAGDEPAKCFRQAMHGRINWGGGTQWKWENAIDLCERSTNANRTISCFKRKVKKGRGWKKAIARCGER